MASLDDWRAAQVLLALAALGLAVRLLVDGGEPLGGVAYRAGAAHRPSVDSVASDAKRYARPLAPEEKIDIDRATAQELVRLPRIGPALAARIVADRERHGAFGSLAGLDRVPGVGPAVLGALERHAVFSGVPRRGVVSGRKISLNTASEEELSELPGIGPGRARAIVEDRARRGRFHTLQDLLRVPGIGPRTVERLRGLVRMP
ncbi:MAG: ComEA family DNA-binding protein [Gemmatimonadales bacterium]